MTVLRDRVAELRPAYRLPEAFGRTEYRPGELAQWDLWFPDYDIPVGHGQTARLPVLVGVPGYSRWILARMIGSKEAPDVLGGHLSLLVELGRVPRVGVYDGEPAISVRRGRRLIYTDDYLRLKGTLGMGSVVLAKGHPERKGCVERVNGYLETSFLPGRRFADRDDFNTQLGEDHTPARRRRAARKRQSATHRAAALQDVPSPHWRTRRSVAPPQRQRLTQHQRRPDRVIAPQP
jgi:hypothetical protein